MIGIFASSNTGANQGEPIFLTVTIASGEAASLTPVKSDSGSTVLVYQGNTAPTDEQNYLSIQDLGPQNYIDQDILWIRVTAADGTKLYYSLTITILS